MSCGRFSLDLSQPRIMGILNVTPDSFSDGGHYYDLERALERAFQMVEQGAHIIDVGGESTRPGAAAVDADTELARVIPLVEKLANQLPVPVSVDTSKAVVMRAAAEAGAGMINDVYALRQEGALAAAADSGLPVCIMHMQGEPRTMQQSPDYQNVVADVLAFLTQRVTEIERAGICRERIIIDPGFGFGKTLQHNLALLRELASFQELDLPVLAGLSRKSMLGQITGREVKERQVASAIAAYQSVLNGASILRVHDVSETQDALKMATAFISNE